MEKLVRDRMPELCAENPDGTYTPMNWRSASTVTEHKNFLLDKLVEEANEVKNAPNKLEIIKEIADVREVVRALMRRLDITEEDVEDARERKFIARGSFNKGIIWDGNY